MCLLLIAEWDFPDFLTRMRTIDSDWQPGRDDAIPAVRIAGEQFPWSVGSSRGQVAWPGEAHRSGDI